MAEISSITSGSNSIDTLVQQYMALEREPVDNLESQKKELQRRLTVFTDLKSNLTSLRDKAKDFTRVGSLNTLNSKKAVLSDSKYFSVDASGSAPLGSHSLLVERLATADTGVSRQLERDTVWDFATGLQEFNISVGDGETATISITIEDTDTNEDVMNKVADAVNASGIDVSASIIKDTSSTSRLILKSGATGSENAINLEEINGSNVLRKLKFLASDGSRRQTEDTTGGFISQNIEDLDALFNLDGIDIVKSANEVSDVLDGITIKLKQVNAADDGPITFSIENDTENIQTEINTFIEKFNEAITYLNNKTAVDTDTFTRGDLAGDFVFSTLKFSIRSTISTPVTGGEEGAQQLLSQIGLEMDRSGLLSIADSAKFNDALNENPDNVIRLFNAEEGVGNRLTDLLDKFVKSGGTVDRSKQGVDRQINSIDSRIENYEARLAIREEVLRQQFTELQKSLSLLNSQQSMLQSYSSLNLSNLSYSSGY